MTDNSGEEYLFGLYRAILKDVVLRYPRLRVDSERDIQRLLSIADTDGYRRLFYVILPALGKHFDQCLSKGSYIPSGLAHSRAFSRKSPIPRLFKGLLLMIFDKSGELRSDPEKEAILFLRQLYLCCKSVRVPCDPSATWSSVDEFFQTDEQVSRPTLSWECDELDLSGVSDLHIGDLLRPKFLLNGPLFKTTREDSFPDVRLSAICDSIQTTADIVCSQLGGFNPFDWKARHGPGAVADARSEEDKYLFPTWPAKLDRIFPYADWAFSSYQHWVDTIDHHSHSDVSSDWEAPARLIAVTKEYTKPRLIAAEPTAHQWCQQVVREFLMERVTKTCISNSISFRDQSRNAELALSASHTGSHSTIDLSSASDRISCWLIERLFRRSTTLLDAFHSVRTRFILNRLDVKSPKLHKLRKFSTMGSALTFPVQTYVFTMIAVGTILYEYNLRPTIVNIRRVSDLVRVFGDDIIVPNATSDSVQEMLGLLGMKVNASKTFADGKFRESCGCDAYDGTDVSRVRLNSIPAMSKPGSVMAAVDTANNFFMKGLYITAEYIRGRVDGDRSNMIPAVTPGSGTFGWYDHAWSIWTPRKKRWNRSLQRIEYLVTTLKQDERKVPTRGASMIHQYFNQSWFPTKFLKRELGRRISISSGRLTRRWVPPGSLGPGTEVVA